MGFPAGSVSKEFTCHAGDTCLIPGLGRAPGKGIRSPLKYSYPWTEESGRLHCSSWGLRESNMRVTKARPQPALLHGSISLLISDKAVKNAVKLFTFMEFMF